MAEFSYNALTPEDSDYRSGRYVSWVEQIENQLFSIREKLQQPVSAYDLDESENSSVKELFVLAALIYIGRKSKQLGRSSNLEELVEEAYLILPKLEHCNKPFPLYIFGLEARTDDRRLLILGIIDRSIEKLNAYNLLSLRDTLSSSWVQDDLNVKGNAYRDGNGCYLSASIYVPCML